MTGRPAAFPCARTEHVGEQRTGFLLAQLALRMGYPDPSKAKKGRDHEQDSSKVRIGAELSSRQGAYLLRVLCYRHENFVFVMTTAAVPRARLAAGMMRTTRTVADYASRPWGNAGARLTGSVPLCLALPRALAVLDRLYPLPGIESGTHPGDTSAPIGVSESIKTVLRGFRTCADSQNPVMYEDEPVLSCRCPAAAWRLDMMHKPESHVFCQMRGVAPYRPAKQECSRFSHPLHGRNSFHEYNCIAWLWLRSQNQGLIAPERILTQDARVVGSIHPLGTVGVSGRIMERIHQTLDQRRMQAVIHLIYPDSPAVGQSMDQRTGQTNFFSVPAASSRILRSALPPSAVAWLTTTATRQPLPNSRGISAFPSSVAWPSHVSGVKSSSTNMKMSQAEAKNAGLAESPAGL